MQRNDRANWRRWWWVPLCGVLIFLPVSGTLGWVLLRLLLVVGALGVVYLWASRHYVPELLRPKDDLSAEEAACKSRLTSLQGHAEQVESTLRELRNAFRRKAEQARVESARSELESSLHEVRLAMARERAVLYSIEGTRWQRQAEPLLRDLDWLNDDFEMAEPTLLEEWVQTRLDRVNQLRPTIMRLQARVCTDTEAAALPAGQTLLRLLRRELTELEHLRADLLTFRSELLAHTRPGEAAEPDPEYATQKLKEVLQRIRTRRDSRLRPQQEATVTRLRQSRVSGQGAPAGQPLYAGSGSQPSPDEAG